MVISKAVKKNIVQNRLRDQIFQKVKICLFTSLQRCWIKLSFVMWVYFCNIFTRDKRESCFWNEAGRVGQKDLGEFSSWSEPQAVCNENVSSLLSGFLQLPSEDVQARLNSAEGNYPESYGAGTGVVQHCPLLESEHPQKIKEWHCLHHPISAAAYCWWTG